MYIRNSKVVEHLWITNDKCGFFNCGSDFKTFLQNCFQGEECVCVIKFVWRYVQDASRSGFRSCCLWLFVCICTQAVKNWGLVVICWQAWRTLVLRKIKNLKSFSKNASKQNERPNLPLSVLSQMPPIDFKAGIYRSW